MMFINETETIGIILSAGTTTLTGSMVATLFLVLFFLIAMCMLFGIPLEFLAVIILPFCLGVGAYYSNFMIPITIILIYVAVLMAKNFLFR